MADTLAYTPGMYQLNPHNNPMRYYFSKFSDEETDTQRFEVILSRLYKQEIRGRPKI